MNLAERNKQIVDDLTVLAGGWKLVAGEQTDAPERKPPRRAPSKPRAPRKPKA